VIPVTGGFALVGKAVEGGAAGCLSPDARSSDEEPLSGEQCSNTERNATHCHPRVCHSRIQHLRSGTWRVTDLRGNAWNPSGLHQPHQSQRWFGMDAH